jgi:hypothetical protein
VAARLARSDLTGAQRLVDVNGCNDIRGINGEGNPPRLVVALLSGKPGCAGFAQALQESSMIWDRGEDIDALHNAVLNRGDECVKELAKTPPDRVAELATLGSGVLSAVEEMRLGDRDKEKHTALKAALKEVLAPVKAMASSQEEQRLAQVRADLTKAVAAKDVATACTLAHKNGLPVPDELRTAEKAALARLEPHFQKVKDVARWPATAVLHNLWLGRIGQSQSLSSSARGWEQPVPKTGFDWSGISLDTDCHPVDVTFSQQFESQKLERGWRVVDVVCQPEQGRTVTTDIYETYTATAPLLLHGEVREKTYKRKVGSRTGVLNARAGAVTVVVAAPFGDGSIKLGATRIVKNELSEAGRGFGFRVEKPLAPRGESTYSFTNDLWQIYQAEVDRNVASWRQLAKDAKDEETREEAFARIALIDGKDEAALAYFRKRYVLSGNEARTLTPPEVPKTCP